MRALFRWVVCLVTVAACIVIAGGAAAWRYHVAAISALLDAQSATARALLNASSGSHDLTVVMALVARPEIRVLPGDGATGAPWPPPDLSQPLGGGPPPGGPPAQNPPPRGHWFAMIAADLAHVPPRIVQSDEGPLAFMPAPEALGRWLLWDIAICALANAALGAMAWTICVALSRTARQPLVRTTVALESLARGNFAPQSVEAGDSPEIARLARAYNAAAETVARSIEERRAAADEFQRFLADAGHELRTPLTIVGGYIDILARCMRDDDATGKRVVAGMSAQTLRMRGLVEKMLLLSRLEANVSAPRVVDVAAVSDEVAQALRAGYPSRRIELRCEPAARIRIDEDDLYEAERNLVENALRHAPGSPVEIRASVQGDAVAVEVADRGPGIPLGEQSMIFERFYRGQDHTDAEGSGLGLAIVRRVVDRWGGTVAVHSDEGGTRFVMRFPRAEPA